ncbi:response regulator transcription factor [Dechloromonas denitrificans]|uniref:response regulator transcription factor n=1 Tax=Dechloromonas denitrificans TaxID=281362 RepID=UPI001CF870AA|nr:response regulator [Dechloromonas denitrificans]UCV02446.1 response regulator transcription factor [Dechloromonas denitrificans]UCV06743.1 response regulator transcription factor [Dechloromonas denitrificans]
MNYQPEECFVHVVDDDAGLRRSLRFLLDSVGWNVQLYASAEEFLDVAAPPSRPSCLLLDIRMPAMSGLELQQVLRERGVIMPILFMTGHADVSMAVQAMKSGASDFIEKPFKDQMLLDTVAAAIRRSAEALDETQRREAALAVLGSLSPREKEAARLIALGQPNKLIATRLGISEKTVHIHRQHIMEKAGISSAAELARLMLRADPTTLD